MPVAFGGGNTEGSIDVATCLTTKNQRIDFDAETFMVTREVAATLTRGSENKNGKGGYAGAILTPNGGRAGVGVGAIAYAPSVYPTLSAGEGGTLTQVPPIAHAIQAGALRTNPNSGPDGVGVQADVAYTLEARAEVQAVQTEWAVRRLTPVECARLQGFPDDYLTQVMHNGKPLADGPMYKGLGNSWPVNSVRWIGRRIQLVEEVAAELAANDNQEPRRAA